MGLPWPRGRNLFKKTGVRSRSGAWPLLLLLLLAGVAVVLWLAWDLLPVRVPGMN